MASRRRTALGLWGGALKCVESGYWFEQKDTINFKGKSVVIRVSYDKTQEYLPMVEIRGTENLHNPDLKLWDEVHLMAEKWLSAGYWRDMEFTEFIFRLFGDD